MDALTAIVPAIVLIVALMLLYRLILVALYRKGDLRAGAKIGPNSFFLEVRDKEKKGSSREFPD
jgi:hypothetical protein